MSDILIDITACPDSEVLASEWPELGLDQLLEEEINDVARLGQQALMSKVPIKTGELRNEDILTFKPDLFCAQVFISGQIHKNTSGSNPPPADVLAALLNLKDYQRSRVSQAESGFTAESGSTQDWIEKALLEFDRHL